MDDIWMSHKELQSRRANRHSQRHLDNIVRQLEQEKDIVRRDWNHKMKSLLAEKRKVMPKGWDPFRVHRPKTAWQTSTKTREMSQFTKSRPCSAISVPVIEKIPDHWILRASYRTTESGERIPIQIPEQFVTRQRTCASAIVRSNCSKSPSSRTPGLRSPSVSRRPFSAPAKSTTKQLNCNGDFNGSLTVRTNTSILRTQSKITSKKKILEQGSNDKLVSEGCENESFSSVSNQDKAKGSNHNSVFEDNDSHVCANGKYGKITNSSKKKQTWDVDHTCNVTEQITGNDRSLLHDKPLVNRPLSAGNYLQKKTSKATLVPGRTKVNSTVLLESSSLLKQVVDLY